MKIRNGLKRPHTLHTTLVLWWLFIMVDIRQVEVELIQAWVSWPFEILGFVGERSSMCLGGGRMNMIQNTYSWIWSFVVCWVQICPTSFQALIPLEQNVGLTQAVNLSSSVVLRSIKKIGHTVAVVRASSIEGRLPSNVVLHWRSPSIKGRHPSKVIFHQRSSSMESCLPSKLVFPQRSTSIGGCLL